MTLNTLITKNYKCTFKKSKIIENVTELTLKKVYIWKATEGGKAQVYWMQQCTQHFRWTILISPEIWQYIKESEIKIETERKTDFVKLHCL